MDGRETAIYNQVLTHFQKKYPNRNIHIKNEYGNQIVCIDDEPKYCLTGYNLLYNLQRLCDNLKDELI